MKIKNRVLELKNTHWSLNRHIETLTVCKCIYRTFSMLLASATYVQDFLLNRRVKFAVIVLNLF